jgi:hypothetical protein
MRDAADGRAARSSVKGHKAGKAVVAEDGEREHHAVGVGQHFQVANRCYAVPLQALCFLSTNLRSDLAALFVDNLEFYLTRLDVVALRWPRSAAVVERRLVGPYGGPASFALFRIGSNLPCHLRLCCPRSPNLNAVQMRPIPREGGIRPRTPSPEGADRDGMLPNIMCSWPLPASCRTAKMM